LARAFAADFFLGESFVDLLLGFGVSHTFLIITLPSLALYG
jgi:hypothetical protein